MSSSKAGSPALPALEFLPYSFLFPLFSEFDIVFLLSFKDFKQLPN